MPHLLAADTVPCALMPYCRDRRTASKSRDADNRTANAWLVCEKHGGYSPNACDRYGWRHQGCPGCARDRYEAEMARPPEQL